MHGLLRGPLRVKRVQPDSPVRRIRAYKFCLDDFLHEAFVPQNKFPGEKTFLQLLMSINTALVLMDVNFVQFRRKFIPRSIF